MHKIEIIHQQYSHTRRNVKNSPVEERCGTMPGVVAHAYNLSFVESRDQRIEV
jgi:hypothetical protein